MTVYGTNSLISWVHHLISSFCQSKRTLSHDSPASILTCRKKRTWKVSHDNKLEIPFHKYQGIFIVCPKKSMKNVAFNEGVYNILKSNSQVYKCTHKLRFAIHIYFLRFRLSVRPSVCHSLSRCNRWTQDLDFWHGYWSWWPLTDFLEIEVTGQRSRSKKW